MVSIGSIIETKKAEMRSAGLLPSKAGLAPLPRAIAANFINSPDLMWKKVESSPLKLLFNFTLPKLEPMLEAMGEIKAEQFIGGICEHARSMIDQNGVDGARQHLEELFNDLPEYRNIPLQRTIEAYRRLHFEGTESFLSYIFGDRRFNIDKEKGISIELRLDSALADAVFLRKVPDFKALRIIDKFGVLDDYLMVKIGHLQSLEEVVIESKLYNGEGIGFLERLPKLTSLGFIGCKMADAEKIVRFSGLRQLVWTGAEIDNRSLPLISQLTELEVLDLSFTKINSHGLRQLFRMKSLKEVRFYGIDIGFRVYKDMKRAIPGLTIIN